MTKLKIGIIVGSTRIGRFAEFPAKWIADVAGKRDDVEVEILDLIDYPMAFFGEERATTEQSETAE
ncbi:NAD(P)H-dependent oxidoreductase, partial [Enterobacter hormaechei]